MEGDEALYSAAASVAKSDIKAIQFVAAMINELGRFFLMDKSFDRTIRGRCGLFTFRIIGLLYIVIQAIMILNIHPIV